ncbi:MAG TPA: CreA family protein [Patescibacteria group bacterium]|nr:CreA family protein [Patescibacteria group bacterium]
MSNHNRILGAAFAAVAIAGAVTLAGCHRDSQDAQKVGEVSTEWHLFGDHKIATESYEDPKVEGITIFVSEAKTGGIAGSVGLAQDTSDVSIAVRQTGPIRVKDSVPAKGEDVLTEKRSAIFKTMHITRFWDEKDKSFVYVAWSNKLVEGSPKNSVSAVVAQPWLNDDGSVIKADLGPLAPKAAPQTFAPR